MNSPRSPSARRTTGLDRVIGRFDRALRTTVGSVGATRRPSPANQLPEAALTPEERLQAARLMRVNHCGEVCAQALYNGQSLTARSSRTTAALDHAAVEETDHLSWCESRIRELDSHVSYLNPFWYAASFGLGAAAGLMGDRVNLGFVAATEENVCEHLEEHLSRLPAEDTRSRAILEQMLRDESGHEQTALELGGARFVPPVKRAMRVVSRLMTRSTYWV